MKFTLLAVTTLLATGVLAGCQKSDEEVPVVPVPETPTSIPAPEVLPPEPPPASEAPMPLPPSSEGSTPSPELEPPTPPTQ